MMKKTHYLLMILAMVAVGLTLTVNSCNKEEEKVATTIALDKNETGPHDIGETITATVTIEAEGVTAFVYYKVVDQVKGDPVDALSSLTQSGKTYTYNFSYELVQGDDVGTLGFEFEVTDDQNVVKTTAILITTNLSVPGMLIKNDWTISSLTWLDGNVLSAGDAAKTFRFYDDGTYEVDLSADPEFAVATHHFCYWVYKETPDNGDTIAVLRLIRRVLSGETAMDEYYDHRITAASESEMTMYWDIAVWGIFDMEQTFTSHPKGSFVPYGTPENAQAVADFEPFNCDYVDQALLEIE
jgi:hypothetical protein